MQLQAVALAADGVLALTYREGARCPRSVVSATYRAAATAAEVAALRPWGDLQAAHPGVGKEGGSPCGPCRVCFVD